jgi:hypothetical protein
MNPILIFTPELVGVNFTSRRLNPVVQTTRDQGESLTTGWGESVRSAGDFPARIVFHLRSEGLPAGRSVNVDPWLLAMSDLFEGSWFVRVEGGGTLR